MASSHTANSINIPAGSLAGEREKGPYSPRMAVAFCIASAGLGWTLIFLVVSSLV